MEKSFAVIDVETTFGNEVMSIGVAIADSTTKELIEARYYVIEPECNEISMYSGALYLKGADICLQADRSEVISDIKLFLKDFAITKIFAYNASFDKNHLPELADYNWFDIMKIAAYKQYNHMIPDSVECYGTGRMKKGYGVEEIIKMLSGKEYVETHNAYFDAIDELGIIRMLGRDISDYDVALLSNSSKKSRRKKLASAISYDNKSVNIARTMSVTNSQGINSITEKNKSASSISYDNTFVNTARAKSVTNGQGVNSRPEKNKSTLKGLRSLFAKLF